MKKFVFLIILGFILGACGDGNFTSRMPFGGGPSPCDFVETEREVAACSAYNHKRLHPNHPDHP